MDLPNGEGIAIMNSPEGVSKGLKHRELLRKNNDVSKMEEIYG